jgi:hypothetical protein
MRFAAANRKPIKYFVEKATADNCERAVFFLDEGYGEPESLCFVKMA